MSGATPYVRVGNMPVVGMLVLMLAMGLFMVKRR
jgi:apolipoprotein N-acyltransferase